MTARPSAPDAAPAVPGRWGQAALAILPTILSVLLMLTTHRLRLELGGVQLPVGLLFGAVYQTVTSIFLWSLTGSRLPVVVLGGLWGLAAMPFLGRGVGGGVLLPGVIGDQVQYSGWIVQLLGIGIPFLVAGILTLARIRELSRR